MLSQYCDYQPTRVPIDAGEVTVEVVRGRLNIMVYRYSTCSPTTRLRVSRT